MTRFDRDPTGNGPGPGSWPVAAGGPGAATTGPTDAPGRYTPLDGLDDGFGEALAAALAPTLELERELAGGAIARVFVAREVALDRRVVAKVLPPLLAAGINRDRFRREIQLAAQLQHPHVVPLLAAGEIGPAAGEAAGLAVGSLYYTMPFIEGESLRTQQAARRARGLPFTWREVLRILRGVAEALGYAHARGVIHRDVKPGNVLVLHGHALVTDFGVAKALASSVPASPLATMTTLGMAIGTPAYMAPEQLAADPAADHRMDLYAAGLVAYELLSGESPFAAASPQATLAAQLTRVPADIAALRPDIPPAFAAVVMQCLAKDPAERPPTAAALLEMLDAVADAPGVDTTTHRTAAAPARAPGRSTRPLTRRERTFAGAALALAAAGGAWVARGPAHAAPTSGPPPASVASVAPARTGGVPAGVPADAVAPSAAAPAADGVHPALSRADSAAIAAAVEREFERAALRHAPRTAIDPQAPAVTMFPLRPGDTAGFRRAARAAVVDSLVRGGDRWSRYSPDMVRSLVGRLATGLPTSPRFGRVPETDGGPDAGSDDPEGPPGRGRTGAFAAMAAALAPPAPGVRRVVGVMLRDATGNPALHAVAPLLDAALRAQLRALGPYEVTDQGMGAVLRHEHVSDREAAHATGAVAVVRGTITTAGDHAYAMLMVYDARRDAPSVVQADAPVGASSTPPTIAEALAAPLARAVAAMLDGSAPDASPRPRP